MVFPKNIFKSIIKNTFNDNNITNKINNATTSSTSIFKHYDQSKSPFTKPQAWNLSIPKLKDDIDTDNQSVSTAATTATSSSDTITPPKSKKRKSLATNHQPIKFTIHKDKDCPLPVVKVSHDMNPASPSAPWMPLSPPKASSNESTYWNLTIPSPANKKKRTSIGDNKQMKKQKVNHRSRVMPLGKNKSVVVDSLMDMYNHHPQQHHQPVLPTLPVISIDEDFPPTNKLKIHHLPTIDITPTKKIRSNSPLFYNPTANKSTPTKSHQLIEQQKYDELLKNAIDSQASYIITKYLVDMYVRHDSNKLAVLTFKEIIQKCIYQKDSEDYLSLVTKLLQYYNDKQYDASSDFITFLTTINCHSESQEEIMISIIKIFLKYNPKLFYIHDSRRNTILHLVLKYQTTYPSAKLLQFLLELNTNNKKRYTSKNKNLLWCKNDLKQFPIHLAMMKRRTISILSLKLLIEMSSSNTKNASFLFDKDSMGCTPINYLWMTRVDKDFHLKCYEKINITYYKSLYEQSLQQLYHQGSRQQVHTLVDLLFGSGYVQILKWLLLSYDTYLHGIISIKEIHVEEIKLLLLLFPEQLLQKDSKNGGRTPMHYAAMKSADVLNICLKGGDDSTSYFYHTVQAAVRIADDGLRLPLHYLIESSSVKKSTTPRVKIELVKRLLQIYPDSIEQCCDVDGNGSADGSLSRSKPFYPFMMAAENATRDDDLDVIYTLLRMSPNLVSK